MPKIITLHRKDILYPETSYKILGCAFDVHNELGSGHPESYYQKALGEAFLKNNLKFNSQVHYPVKFNGTAIGKRFLDFLVDNVIIVEIKKGDRFSKSHIDQVLNYLKISDLKLALLINFGARGVVSRRIINFDA